VAAIAEFGSKKAGKAGNTIFIILVMVVIGGWLA